MYLASRGWLSYTPSIEQVDVFLVLKNNVICQLRHTPENIYQAIPTFHIVEDEKLIPNMPIAHSHTTTCTPHTRTHTHTHNTHTQSHESWSCRTWSHANWSRTCPRIHYYLHPNSTHTHTNIVHQPEGFTAVVCNSWWHIAIGTGDLVGDVRSTCVWVDELVEGTKGTHTCLCQKNHEHGTHVTYTWQHSM